MPASSNQRSGYTACKDSQAIATNRVKSSSDSPPAKTKPKTQTYMIYKTILASLTALVIAAASSFAQDGHKSGPFQGAKANTGYVTHTTESGNKNGKLFFDMTSAGTEDALDGLKVDKAGNLYVSGPGGLWILSPEGKHLGTIIAPKHPHNFAWGDADGKTLYLCARSGLYRMKLNIEGIRP